MKTNKILKILVAIVILISIETSAIAASTGVVNVETVRVREKATTDSDIVELVSIGDKITIIGEEGDWYKVKVGKVTGYIRKDLLTVDGKTTTVEPKEEDTPNQTEEPENNDKTPVEETPKEEEPENTPTQNEPADENTDGQDGETSIETGAEVGQDTTVVSQKEDRTISVISVAGSLTAGRKITLTQNTKIKILPSANSNNIAEIQANSEVTVIEKINNWCRIESSEGACGWVRIDQ